MDSIKIMDNNINLNNSNNTIINSEYKEAIKYHNLQAENLTLLSDEFKSY